MAIFLAKVTYLFAKDLFLEKIPSACLNKVLILSRAISFCLFFGSGRFGILFERILRLYLFITFEIFDIFSIDIKDIAGDHG